MIPHALAKGVWGNVLKNIEKTKIVSKMGKQIIHTSTTQALEKGE
jgi:hypothetical protein